MAERDYGRQTPDYYKVLGVPSNADAKTVKAAYRKLARQWHPDLNKKPGATEKLQEINEAYAVLSDAEKRSIYDQYKHERRWSTPPNPPRRPRPSPTPPNLSPEVQRNIMVGLGILVLAFISANINFEPNNNVTADNSAHTIYTSPISNPTDYPTVVNATPDHTPTPRPTEKPHLTEKEILAGLNQDVLPHLTLMSALDVTGKVINAYGVPLSTENAGHVFFWHLISYQQIQLRISPFLNP